MQRSHESSEGAMSHTGCCATIFFGADLRAGCRLGYSFVERMKTDRMEGTMTSITRRSVLRGAIAVAAGAFTGHPVLALTRSEEHTSELQSLTNLVCRPLLEK